MEARRKLAALRRRGRRRPRVVGPRAETPAPTVQVVVNVAPAEHHGVRPGRPGQRASDDRLRTQIRPYPG